jgi:hypothetical protein
MGPGGRARGSWLDPLHGGGIAFPGLRGDEPRPCDARVARRRQGCEAFIEQITHVIVSLSRSVTAEYDADDATAVALRRRRKVVARSPCVAGLDTVRAGIVLQQHVPAGQQRDQQALEHGVLAHDHALHLEQRLLERYVGSLAPEKMTQVGSVPRSPWRPGAPLE